MEFAGKTRFIDKPIWSGDGFQEPEAQAFWMELPEPLREVAKREMELGNAVSQILRNDERDLVLLAFERGPLGDFSQGSDLEIHTRFELGNYCYDDTLCTVKHRPSGCFLSFDEPES
jgi:hypothetical protein